MAQRLTLICCGPTAVLKRGVFPRDDEPLDENAQPDANALVPIRGAVEVWTSPLQRARQTAGLLCAQPAVVEDLRDQDFGTWAGKSLKQVHETEPQALSSWLADPEAPPPGGEAFSGVMARAASILARCGEGRGHIVAVTHPAVIRAVLLHVLQAPAAAFNRIDVEPFGATDLRGDGRAWRLRATGISAASAIG